MKILLRNKIHPVTVVSGDSIVLEYTDEYGRKSEHAKQTITKAQTFDEVFLFSDVIDGKNALGGGWLEEKK